MSYHQVVNKIRNEISDKIYCNNSLFRTFVHSPNTLNPTMTFDEDQIFSTKNIQIEGGDILSERENKRKVVVKKIKR